MDWIKVSFPFNTGDPTTLQSWYEARWEASGVPAEAGLFGRVERHGTDMYFSPEAVRIAGREALTRAGGVPCNRPPREGTSALVVNGDPFALFD